MQKLQGGIHGFRFQRTDFRLPQRPHQADTGNDKQARQGTDTHEKKFVMKFVYAILHKPYVT